MQTKNRKASFAMLSVLLMLLLAFVLTACGESATATPAPTATPTQPPTATLAPTTVPATTVAVATTTANTGGSSTTTAAAGGDNSALPAISGTTEVALDTSIIQPVIKQFGISNATVKLYTSDDAAAKSVDAADAAITGAGYSFSIPGASKPSQQGGAYVGLYTKSGAADIVLVGVDVPADPSQVVQQLSSQLSIFGVSSDVVTKLADQVKGKKSALFAIAAPGLLQAIISGLAGAGSSSATATPSQ